MRVRSPQMPWLDLQLIGWKWVQLTGEAGRKSAGQVFLACVQWPAALGAGARTLSQPKGEREGPGVGGKVRANQSTGKPNTSLRARGLPRTVLRTCSDHHLSRASFPFFLQFRPHLLLYLPGPTAKDTGMQLSNSYAFFLFSFSLSLISIRGSALSLLKNLQLREGS